MSDPVYDPIAAFAAGLASRGVRHVVISPGSRSTPLALTLHAQPALRTWIQLDERSAGFFALGIGRATGVPAVLVCTSGTAAANYLPAVVEAHHAGVPLVVCTADRPPELRDWGAGQTIDQVGIYGTATRWFADLPVAGEWTADRARVAALRAVETAAGARPGPVHLNWPLREPLEPVDEVPVVDVAESPEPPAPELIHRPRDPLQELAEVEKGVIVVGPSDGVGLHREHAVAEAIQRFSSTRGWPVIGEPLTQIRRWTGVIATADHLLKDDGFATATAPDVVVRIGRSPTTKPVRRWMERHRPDRVVLLDPSDHWHDASFTVTDHLRMDPTVALSVDPREPRWSAWRDRWDAAEREAAAAIAAEVDAGPLLSARVSRTLVGAVDSESIVMVSNSMPVRDLDAFVTARPGLPTFVGNRGASGIDGITSTALGLAAVTTGPVVAFVGDLALLHDLGALYTAGRLGLHLTIVCVDNDGGGIFSMLPIAGRADADDFETLFRTRHGLDLAALGGTGGVRPAVVREADDLAERLRRTTTAREPGVDLLVVPVDREADLAQRRAVTAAVHAAIR